MVYIVTYDLQEPGQRYDDLISRIKNYNVWAKIGYSCYLIETNATAVQVRDSLRPAIDANDRLFVSVVSAPAAWLGLPDSVSQWIKEKF